MIVGQLALFQRLKASYSEINTTAVDTGLELEVGFDVFIYIQPGHHGLILTGQENPRQTPAATDIHYFCPLRYLPGGEIVNQNKTGTPHLVAVGGVALLQAL